MQESKKTSLYDAHRALHGKMVDFAGWSLPIQYSGLKDEHLTCRTQAGLFDVSHMGEIIVKGSDSAAFLDFALTNKPSGITTGQAQYSLMCNSSGGTVDDLVLYRRKEEEYLVVVNASNTAKDFQHLLTLEKEAKEKLSLKNFNIENVSHQYTQIAIQGPNAESILQKITDVSLSEIRTYFFKEGNVLKNTTCILARTGYTGEDGFELYFPWESGPKVWQALLEVGKPQGLKPCGLGARDTLRLEMAYPLYGHELNDQITPIEAGLGWVVKLEKDHFVGKDPITKQKQQGANKKLVGIELTERGIPREGCLLYSGENQIGKVTSGTFSPSLEKGIALAYMQKDFSKIDTPVSIEIRGRKIGAKIVKKPFYSPKTAA